MPLTEMGERKHSGIAWIVAIPSQAEGLVHRNITIYLITFYNVSMLLGDCLQTAHLSLVISYRNNITSRGCVNCCGIIQFDHRSWLGGYFDGGRIIGRPFVEMSLAITRNIGTTVLLSFVTAISIRQKIAARFIPSARLYGVVYAVVAHIVWWWWINEIRRRCLSTCGVIVQILTLTLMLTVWWH